MESEKTKWQETEKMKNWRREKNRTDGFTVRTFVTIITCFIVLTDNYNYVFHYIVNTTYRSHYFCRMMIRRDYPAQNFPTG